MIASLVFVYSAVALSSMAALGVLLRRPWSIAKFCFAAGMLGFCAESLFGAIWLQSRSPEEALIWERCALLTRSILPAIWLAFSVTYSRGNAREYLAKAWFLLAVALVLPVGATLSFLQQLDPNASVYPGFSAASKILSGLLLVANVLVLMNFERTIRSAVGTTRWRLKFTIFGFAVIFGARIYT